MGIVDTETIAALNEELDVLTERLADMDITRPGRGWAIYDVPNGTCIGLNLDNDGKRSVQEIFMTDGTLFPRHLHDTYETLVAVDASFEIEYADGSVVVVKPGGCAHFPPGTAHTVRAVGDGKRIAVSVPADEAYPSDR